LSPGRRGWLRAIGLGAIVLALDQVTKQIAAARIAAGEHVDLVLGFHLADVRNKGVAFGLFGEGEGLLILITAAALVAVLTFFARDPARPGLWVGVGLLIGGAIGNLADRIRDGSVIDFIDPPHYPTFNLADVAIVVGIAVVVLIQLGTGEDQAAQRPET
jgi:signal peptidase II